MQYEIFHLTALCQISDRPSLNLIISSYSDKVNILLVLLHKQIKCHPK